MAFPKVIKVQQDFPRPLVEEWCLRSCPRVQTSKGIRARLLADYPTRFC